MEFKVHLELAEGKLTLAVHSMPLDRLRGCIADALESELGLQHEWKGSTLIVRTGKGAEAAEMEPTAEVVRDTRSPAYKDWPHVPAVTLGSPSWPTALQLWQNVNLYLAVPTENLNPAPRQA